MSKFDQKIGEIQKEVSLLNEVDTSSIGRFFGSLAQGVRQGRPVITPKYDPQNVYYLIGGFKSLPMLKKPLPSGNFSKDDMFNPSTGKITNIRKLAVQLYNAFDNAITMGQNSITLDQILRGEIYSGQGQKRQFTGNIRKEPNKEPIHNSLMQFINQKGLANIVKYMTPEQATEAEKGSLFKQAGKALGQATMTGIKTLGSEIGKQVTTSQNSGGGGALYQ
jgi:hypothetical protein